jgi:hypothetical protein
MMSGLGHFNDAISFAELIPALSSWLSGTAAASITSVASFAGVLLFPVQQIINIINANETGLRAYSYRGIAYAITAWAFDKPKPMSSPQILSNIKRGPVVTVQGVGRYNQVWMQTVSSVTNKITEICSKNNINEEHLKAVFRAFGRGSPEKLSVLILKGFEKEFSPVTVNMWKSNYKVAYPR